MEPEEIPVNTEMQRHMSPNPHVLVAEDDVPLANFLRRQLESEAYDVQLVQDGEAELRVTIQSDITAAKYALASVAQRRQAGDSARDYLHGPSPEPPPVATEGIEGVFHVRSYLVTLRIDGDTPPRPYDVDLLFTAPEQKPEMRTIRLYVGAKDARAYVDAETIPASPSIAAGQESRLSLLVRNNFPTYALTLTRIKVSSEPDGIVDAVDDRQRTDKLRSGGAQTRIELPLKGRRSILWYLWPVEPHPRLRVSLYFDDGFRKDVERLPPIDFTFRLEDPAVAWSLAIASVVLGAALGAGVRLTRDHYTAAAVRKKRRMPPSVGLTIAVVLAGVIVLFIMLTRLELLIGANDYRLPLHTPLATLVISFVLGLYDPAQLIGFLRRRFPLQPAGSGES